MKKGVLRYTNKVELYDNTEMILEYYLVQETKVDPLREIYGIEIVKKHGEVMEGEMAEAISYSEAEVIRLIDILFTNTVTPCTMIEIIDDLITMQQGA